MFKTVYQDSNGRYVDCTNEKQCKKYSAEVIEIELELGVKFPDIKKVYIGNASNPLTEISFGNDLVLYSKESIGGWHKKNKDIYNEWKTKREGLREFKP
ncbi:hypothetical protein [Bacillus atrophaeus]|uniref:hypothetical protein n=1 Tax=Bacillus atrophaeus TaxID=1452 RepID=UPI002E22A209|nr:hypothetical protein [Bacillus atrophaeus]